MSVLDQLRTRAAAEDFFALLEVPYDQAVLNVSRLHILKRMGQYLAQETFTPSDPEVDVKARCQAVLIRAYNDFTTSTPIEQRVFKVHQDAVKPKPAKKPVAFVPLSALTSPAPVNG